MHRHCGTNNRAPRWTFTDPCKQEVRPGAREKSASPAWLAAPAMNARDTTEVYIWRLDTGYGPTLYRKCHSHNTPGKRHNNTWVEPLAENCTTRSTRQRGQVLHIHFLNLKSLSVVLGPVMPCLKIIVICWYWIYPFAFRIKPVKFFQLSDYFHRLYFRQKFVHV